MTSAVVLDTGPLVALLQRGEAHHLWAVRTIASVPPPVLSCEAVVTEALYLTRTRPAALSAVAGMVADGIIDLSFSLRDEAAAVFAMMQRYANVPMSLADACLVRMAELHRGSRIFTLDSDFTIYRRHGHEPLDLIIPPGE